MSSPTWTGWARPKERPSHNSNHYAGLWIENRLAMGPLVVGATRAQGGQVITMLHQASFGVTTVAGQEVSSLVKLLYTVTQHKNLKEALVVSTGF